MAQVWPSSLVLGGREDEWILARGPEMLGTGGSHQPIVVREPSPPVSASALGPSRERGIRGMGDRGSRGVMYLDGWSEMGHPPRSYFEGLSMSGPRCREGDRPISPTEDGVGFAQRDGFPIGVGNDGKGWEAPLRSALETLRRCSGRAELFQFWRGILLGLSQRGGVYGQ